MNLALESIGLIAGSRTLPLDFARLARAAGVRRIVCTAVEGETDPALAALVDDIVWLKVGQLNKMIATFTDRLKTIEPLSNRFLTNHFLTRGKPA